MANFAYSLGTTWYRLTTFIFQLLHQGTQIVNAEFIICAQTHNPIADMHERLIANCFAQSAALMLGKSEQEVVIELQASGLSHQKYKNYCLIKYSKEIVLQQLSY